MQERARGRSRCGCPSAVDSSGNPPPKYLPLACLLAVALLAAGVDLFSKWWVFRWWAAQGFRATDPRHLIVGDPRHDLIPGYLGVYVTYNDGGIFSIGQGRTSLFILFSAFAIVAILWVFHRYGRMSVWLTVALGLILGGALGNLWDRICYGAVRDFIEVHVHDAFRWPAFNLADAFICIGAGMMLLSAFRHSESPASMPRESGK